MQLLSFLIIILFIYLLIHLVRYNSATQKGKRGEKHISTILSQLPNEYTTLNDIVFRTEKGTTQIDHVVVSKYGIFAIETKNYRGEIYGNDIRQEWTQLIVTQITYIKTWWKTYTYITKNHFYNPVKQSLGHALRIKELLTEYPHVKIIPIVVFTGKAELKAVESRHHVIIANHLTDVIKQFQTVHLTDNEVHSIIGILKENNIREIVSDKQHIKNLQQSEKATKTTIKSGICPKCGGSLVKRNGKYGNFYGCSNYPKCRFTTE